MVIHTELPIRPGTPDDWTQVHHLLRTAFHSPYDERDDEAGREVFEPERTLLIQDGDTLVAQAAAYSRELTVPGGVVSAAHVTGVAVAATHRRRGLLSRLMRHQLREIRHAGREPVAALWASEGRIYPRFGYGQASRRLALNVDLREVDLPGGGAPGRLRVGEPVRLQPELAGLYRRLQPERPGWSSRDERWWRHVLADVPSGRGGGTEQRAVLHDGETGVDGYALWRNRSEWSGWSPQGEVRVQEVVAANPKAYREIWRFLLTQDLTRTVTYPFACLDEPLQYLVTEPRRLGAQLIDGLWVRIVDLPAALGARRYAGDVDLVLEVSDPLLPENDGCWRLTADGTGARCVRTTEAAGLALEITDLGAAYLGGSPLAALAAADRVRELRPGALTEASRAFGWHRDPAMLEIF